MTDAPLTIPKLREVELPKPEKRKPLTRVEFATLILRQEGRCGCGCGERLVANEIVDEHLHALTLGGGNELTNRSLWRKQCAQKKTDTFDKPASAKGKRLRGETSSQVSRRKARGPVLKSNAKLQSRGFSERKGPSQLSKAYRDKVRERMERG